MQASREGNQIVLEFAVLEKQVLLHIFESVIRNYRQKPQEVDPRVAKVWYSTNGCKSAGMTAEETREWIRGLYEFKSANLAHLEKWAAEMAANPTADSVLK